MTVEDRMSRRLTAATSVMDVSDVIEDMYAWRERQPLDDDAADAMIGRLLVIAERREREVAVDAWPGEQAPTLADVRQAHDDVADGERDRPPPRPIKTFEGSKWVTREGTPRRWRRPRPRGSARRGRRVRARARCRRRAARRSGATSGDPPGDTDEGHEDHDEGRAGP